MLGIIGFRYKPAVRKHMHTSIPRTNDLEESLCDLLRFMKAICIVFWNQTITSLLSRTQKRRLSAWQARISFMLVHHLGDASRHHLAFVWLAVDYSPELSTNNSCERSTSDISKCVCNYCRMWRVYHVCSLVAAAQFAYRIYPHTEQHRMPFTPLRNDRRSHYPYLIRIK